MKFPAIDTCLDPAVGKKVSWGKAICAHEMRSCRVTKNATSAQIPNQKKCLFGMTSEVKRLYLCKTFKNGIYYYFSFGRS
jgi:hypothetical protein